MAVATRMVTRMNKVNSRPTEASGVFGEWQPKYACRGIATFPVCIEGKLKKPAVRGYLKTTIARSKTLRPKFSKCDAIGFALGCTTNITVLDIDTPDKDVLSEAVERHGKSPIVVRSGSGNHQVWYRHSGERRCIRPNRNKPIDVLGGGFVVAPPSKGSRCRYEFIEGSLDDVARLPVIRSLDEAGDSGQVVQQGERNTGLWQHCMREAHHCDDLDALLDVARTYNEDALRPPLSDDEVVKTVSSAWEYTVTGQNRFGQTGSWSPTEEVNRLVTTDQDAFCLLSYLRAHNGPKREFMIANDLRNNRRKCCPRRLG